MEGVYRFLGRLWRLAVETAERSVDGEDVASAVDAEDAEPFAFENLPDGPDLELLRKSHWAIEKVSGDLRRFAFNTAIAAVMELLNECSRLRESASVPALRFALTSAASLLFPFAPHVSAEVHELLTGERVWELPWPQADPALLESDEYELVCQVNGKLRDRVQARSDASEDELRELCMAAPNVQAHLEGRQLVKEIVVPGKLVNLVVR
jgi:leucyl-tRNA synthetase